MLRGWISPLACCVRRAVGSRRRSAARLSSRRAHRCPTRTPAADSVRAFQYPFADKHVAPLMQPHQQHGADHTTLGRTRRLQTKLPGTNTARLSERSAATAGAARSPLHCHLPVWTASASATSLGATGALGGSAGSKSSPGARGAPKVSPSCATPAATRQPFEACYKTPSDVPQRGRPDGSAPSNNAPVIVM